MTDLRATNTVTDEYQVYAKGHPMAVPPYDNFEDAAFYAEAAAIDTGTPIEDYAVKHTIVVTTRSAAIEIPLNERSRA